MKTMKVNCLTVLFLLISTSLLAQVEYPIDSTAKLSIWNKKIYWGVMITNSLTTIKGTSMPDQYFWKPSVGGAIKWELYINRHIGIGIETRYQQNGSGIITEDKVKVLGDPDSTYRARIKLSAFELPIIFLFRSGEVIQNTRFHGSLGVAPLLNFQSKYVLYSAEDGFHTKLLQNERYYKNDIAITASAGIDVNAGNSCIFQIHFYGTWGQRNVFTDYYSNAEGQTRVIGLKFGWLF